MDGQWPGSGSRGGSGSKAGGDASAASGAQQNAKPRVRRTPSPEVILTSGFPSAGTMPPHPAGRKRAFKLAVDDGTSAE